MSAFGIEPINDLQEFDAAAIGAGVDLVDSGSTNGPARILRVIDPGAGGLDVTMAGSGGAVRTLTVSAGEVLIGFFVTIRGTSSALRVRAGW